MREAVIVPLEVELKEVGEDGRVRLKSLTFERDEGPRPDTTPEGLAKLRPVFHAKGSVRARRPSSRTYRPKAARKAWGAEGVV